MRENRLTPSEWYVMECLWAQSPMSVMGLVSAMRDKVGWAKSTTITTLRRMEAKGLISAESVERGHQYVPCADRDSCVREETRSFLDRVYQGSVGLLVSSMARERTLTKQEIADLYEILQKAEEENL